MDERQGIAKVLMGLKALSKAAHDIDRPAEFINGGGQLKESIRRALDEQIELLLRAPDYPINWTLYDFAKMLRTAADEVESYLQQKSESALDAESMNYETLVQDEIKKYMGTVFEHCPVAPRAATMEQIIKKAKMEFLTFDGQHKIFKALQESGSIVHAGYKNGISMFCVPKGVILDKPTEEPFQLRPPTSEEFKGVVFSVLKGNRYLTLAEIYEEIRLLFPPDVTLAKNDILSALDELVSRKKVRKQEMVGGHETWKKPTRTFKKMREGEWKLAIVKFLDQRAGKKFTHKEICEALALDYADSHVGKTPQELHGSIGSALNRLVRDKKLKRFHYQSAIGGKKFNLYWVDPLPRALPLPLPRN